MDPVISLAGIKERDDGTREVPASQRSDGTVRAPIRIRPGYVPAADKPKYKPPRTREPTTMDEPSSSTVIDSGVVLPRPQESRSLVALHTVNESITSGKATNSRSTTVRSKCQENEMLVETRSSVKDNSIREAPKLVSDVKANEKLTAWSSLGWRGAEDTPSRFAKPSTDHQDGGKMHADHPNAAEYKEASSKTSRPPRHRASKKNKKHLLVEQLDEDVDDEYLMLEAELNKMKLRG